MSKRYPPNLPSQFNDFGNLRETQSVRQMQVLKSEAKGIAKSANRYIVKKYNQAAVKLSEMFPARTIKVKNERYSK